MIKISYSVFLLLLSVMFIAPVTTYAVQREDCNQKAAGKLGSERARIISACIRHNASINTVPPMLAKITECNQKAGDMEGERRVKFVDACMKDN